MAVSKVSATRPIPTANTNLAGFDFGAMYPSGSNTLLVLVPVLVPAGIEEMCELLHTSNRLYFDGNNKGPLSIVAAPTGGTSPDLRTPVTALDSKTGKKNQRAPASANFARRAPHHSRSFRSTTAATMPALSKMDLQRAAA
jgi:hypothetical protein